LALPNERRVIGTTWTLGVLLCALVVIGVAVVWIQDPSTSDHFAAIAVGEALIGIAVAAYAAKLTRDGACISQTTLRMQRTLRDLDVIERVLREVASVLPAQMTPEDAVSIGSSLEAMPSTFPQTVVLMKGAANGKATAEQKRASLKELRDEMKRLLGSLR
jgi:hypothetical protein